MKKEEFLLILSSSLSGLIMGSNSIIISLYLLSLGLSALEIGELLSLGVLVGSFVSLLLSFLGDLYGRKNFAIFSRGISTLSFFFLFLGIPIAYVFSITWDAGGLLFSLLAEKSENLDKALGLRQSLTILFSVVGSLLPIFLEYRSILSLDVLINLSALLLLLPIKEKFKGSKKLKLGSLKVVSKFSTEAIIGLGAGLVIPLMSLWFYLKFGVSSSEMSPVFAISEFTLAFSSYGSVLLAEKLGKVKTIVYTHSLAIVLLFLLPFSSDFIIASLIFVSRNVLMNMTSPVFESLLLKLIPEDERGRANGIVGFMESIPRAIGPSIGGFFFNEGNLVLPFFITGFLYSFATLLFFIWFKREEHL
ncbi:MFS transporter [Acidianus sp. HS-5]|uniref:MFS transporter n=1 Tax=Acidianus sp. HS-5 TaxID=2886040 RepID=UPI001F00CB0D|nr:MFS transporter [Acidianus sp. HS-5]